YLFLKLYPEEEFGPQSTKKPVVVESYDEIVFSEPSEGFLAHVQNHPAVVVPRLPAGLTLPSPCEFFQMFFFIPHSVKNPLNVSIILAYAVPIETGNGTER
ncbi:hypothetical protein S245_025416, partial [Arachis hypogaea]